MKLQLNRNFIVRVQECHSVTVTARAQPLGFFESRISTAEFTVVTSTQLPSPTDHELFRHSVAVFAFELLICTPQSLPPTNSNAWQERLSRRAALRANDAYAAASSTGPDLAPPCHAPARSHARSNGLKRLHCRSSQW